MTPRKTKSNGWEKYKKLFESEMHFFHIRFDKIDAEFNRIQDNIVDLKVKVGQLTTKSSIHYLVGSVISIAVVIGVYFLKSII